MIRNTVLYNLLFLFVLVAGPAVAQQQHDADYDARIEHNLKRAVTPPSAVQKAAEASLARRIPGLAVDYDRRSGAARNVRHHMGYLTGPQPGANPVELTLEAAGAHLDLLGLSPRDIEDYEVTDVVYSKLSGATYVYLRQLHQGIPVYNGQMSATVNRDGRILGLRNAFVPDLASRVGETWPRLSAARAAAAAAEHLGKSLGKSPRLLEQKDDPQKTTRLAGAGISRQEIVAQLFWLPVDSQQTRLVWNFETVTEDGEHAYVFNVDAGTGKVWTRFDMVDTYSYNVFPQPLADPNEATPPAPSDGRVLVVDPEDLTVSPNGWLDDPNGVMAGNNVYACGDHDGDTICDAGEPNCTNGVCDFPLDLTIDPTNSLDAAITNLFYWTNLVHDVQYQYGFDEEAGNFQEDNFGLPGLGSDSVEAFAQHDVTGTMSCNAGFRSRVDGNNPTMKMYLCDSTSPSRDGALTNIIIVHEYGHGISNRQIGGPAVTGCIRNAQGPGEGWSDWLAMVYTAKATDQGSDARTFGEYYLNLPPGQSSRGLPYSTDPAVNSWTYGDINGASIPHGVGARWAQVLWKAYWALVDQHGFEADLLHFDVSDLGEAGNKRALFYVNEGLKGTICSPTFVDARDAILQAAADNFGGEDVCTLWDVFADFGLGIDANPVGPASTAPIEGFLPPPECPDMIRRSVATRDGYVRELTETSGVGGWAASAMSGNTALRVGDNNSDRQLKTIVHFNTAGIPDGATMVAATLRLTFGSAVVTNPFTSGFGQAEVDIATGFFGPTMDLTPEDFEATPTASAVGYLSTPSIVGDVAEASLDAAGLAAISKIGVTQFRIAFELDDNDNLAFTYAGFYAGEESNPDWRPQLLVYYYE